MIPDYRGLNQLANPQTQPSASGHPGIRSLMAILASTPNLPPDFIQTMLGGAFKGIQTRQATNAATVQNALGSAVQYAGEPQASPTGLQAIMGIAGQGMNPTQRASLAGQSANLNALIPSSATAGTADTITPAEQPGIAANVVTLYQNNATAPHPADPATTLKSIITTISQQAIGQGKSPTGVAAAVAWAKQVYAQLSGQTPQQVEQTLSPAASSAAGGRFPMVAGQMTNPMLQAATQGMR